MPLGFLRSKKDKEAKNSTTSSASTADEEYSENPLPSETFGSSLSSRKEVDSFYSDSDTSDDEDTYTKPIKVVIRPINGLENGNKSDTLSELKQAAMSLSSVTLGSASSLPKSSKRTIQSATQLPAPPSSAITFPAAWQVNNSSSGNTKLGSSSAFDSSSGLSSSIASIWSKNESISSATMSRCKSYSSLTSNSDTFHRMTPVSVNSFGSSRGPSPFTIGFDDTVPLAVALQESISAKFHGTNEFDTDIRILGSLKIAFPSGIVTMLASNPNPPPLAFKLKNTSLIEKLYPNNSLLDSSLTPAGSKEYSFSVNMNGLINVLKKLLEQNVTARYHILDLLKYQVKTAPGASSCPLQVVSHWKCDANVTGVKIEYKFNPTALSSIQPLKNVSFSVPINATIKDIQGRPQPTWNALTKTASWSYPSISHLSDDSGLGSLRAKFHVVNGPVLPAPVTVTFSTLDTSISGIAFDLNGPKYRISMVKQQMTARIYSSTSKFNTQQSSETHTTLPVTDDNLHPS